MLNNLNRSEVIQFSMNPIIWPWLTEINLVTHGNVDMKTHTSITVTYVMKQQIWTKMAILT